MRKVFLSVVLVVVMACGSAAQIVKDVISATVAACVAEHPEIVNEPTMRTICQYDEALAPIVINLMGAQQRGLAHLRGQQDGGAPAAK